MSDEAHFHFTGYVSTPTYCYWADTHPNEVHKSPIYDSKVTVWYALSSHEIIEQYFSKMKRQTQ